MEGIPEHYQVLLNIAIASIRPAAIFLVLPAFNPQSIQPLVRNSIFISLGLVSFALTSGADTTNINLSIPLLLREVFIGLTIGLFFSAILYALEIAGQIIDYVTGRAFASMVDPLGGHASTLTGVFYARMAQFLFMIAGGLTLIVGTLIESYALWPLHEPTFSLNPQGVEVFKMHYGAMMSKALMFATPALCVMFVVDMALGLMNRFAQQVNIFALTISIKAWVSIFVVMACLGIVTESVIVETHKVASGIIDHLHFLLN
ncbi:MAG: type III secretion system export apparatus subunit SctT [Aquisalinus sp.]|nr:type III secretion system export apparatus subunit SctT [Aquisalinus sp.]